MNLNEAVELVEKLQVLHAAGKVWDLIDGSLWVKTNEGFWIEGPTFWSVESLKKLAGV